VNPQIIVERASAMGINLKVKGDKIQYFPKSRTPHDFVELLQTNKEELLDYLSQRKEAECLHPVVWKGTVQEYRSLLVLRQAELVAAKAQLTGNDRADRYANNVIRDLETKIADLRVWLAEAMEKNNPTNTKQEECE